MKMSNTIVFNKPTLPQKSYPYLGRLFRVFRQIMFNFFSLSNFLIVDHSFLNLYITFKKIIGDLKNETKN
jgi:hypothetical protein